MTLIPILLLASALPAAAGAVPRLRAISPTETAVIADLLARSATARALLAAIEATDVIVYVQLTGDLAPGRAATRLAGATGTHRYLRVVLGVMTHPADRGPLLAHELQHVLEIGSEPWVRDDNTLRQLYKKIGEDRTARFAFETTSARETGARVSREMAAAPPALHDTPVTSGATLPEYGSRISRGVPGSTGI